MKEQTNTLASALLKLQALNLNEEQVRRVAVASQGSIYIETHEDEKQRYFVFEEKVASALLVIKALHSNVLFEAFLKNCNFQEIFL